MPEHRKNFYKRFIKDQGLTLPTREETRREYDKTIGGLFIPDGALVVGHHPETGSPVYFHPEELSTHLHVIGASGRGKSYALRALVEQLFRRHDATGEGIGIIDPHGTLAQFALDLCVSRGINFADKVVCFDLSRDKLPFFNPLTVARPEDTYAAASRLAEAMVKGLSAGADRSQDKILTSQSIRKVAGALIHTGLSLAAADIFLEHSESYQAIRRRLISTIPDERLQAFWQKVNELPLDKMDFHTGPAERRFDLLLSSPLFMHLFGQNLPGVDLKRLMDEGGIAIFNLAREGTSITQEQQDLLGALLIQEFRNVTEQRAPDVSRPFTLMVDEFGDFVSADAMRIFTGTRKFGLRCVLAHQDLHQLLLKDNDFRLHAAVLAIENKIIFGGGPVEDTLQLAQQVYSDFIDTEQRKFENWQRGFEPITKLVNLYGGSSNWNEGTGACTPLS